MGGQETRKEDTTDCRFPWLAHAAWKVLGDVVVARRRGHKSVQRPRPEDLKCSDHLARRVGEQLAWLAQVAAFRSRGDQREHYKGEQRKLEQ